MTLPHILLWAAFNGPRVRREVSGRDVLAEHLDWARRSRRASKPREQDEPLGAHELSEPFAVEAGAEDGAPPPLDPIDGCDAMASAAAELEHAWQADVLASVPSQLVVGLGGTAQRAAFLLDEVAPELASRFADLAELFMSHGDGDRPASDEELGIAVDELEALVSAVAERAREAYERLPPASRDALVERWKERAEDPRGEQTRSCRSCGDPPGPASAPGCAARDRR